MNLWSKACSPGKIILSGEHAIVYQAPALILTVNQHTRTSLRINTHKKITFHSHSFKHDTEYTFSALHSLCDAIEKRFQDYKANSGDISSVLHSPFDLVPLALFHFFQENNMALSGLEIAIESDISPGCGMGASAACLISLYTALNALFDTHYSPRKIIALATHTEHYQHGTSSGIDCYAVQKGGGHFINASHFKENPPLQFPLALIHTGTPESSTGECVNAVSHFKTDSNLWKSFSTVTHAMQNAWLHGNQTQFHDAIDQNHQLLCHIGVVPPSIQRFISALNKRGSHAKICGAGSVRGDNGGIVLATLSPHLEELCHQYHYTLEKIHPTMEGTTSVSG
jgi:mevalonate kinase